MLEENQNAPGRADELLEAFASFDAFGVREREVDFAEAIELAQAAQLSLYDASYLWLAGNMSAELVTLDKRLGQAALAV